MGPRFKTPLIRHIFIYQVESALYWTILAISCDEKISASGKAFYCKPLIILVTPDENYLKPDIQFVVIARQHKLINCPAFA